jgi:cell division protein FtsB
MMLGRIALRVQGPTKARSWLARPARPRHAALQPRRSRTLLIASAIFALVVLGTSMPLSTLLAQRSQLSATSAQLRGLEQQDNLLQKEARQLSKSQNVARIANRDYGLVPPGTPLYEVLLSPYSASRTGATGQVPLDGPLVAPGSAQSQSLIGAGVAAQPSQTDRSSRDGSLPPVSPSRSTGASSSGGTAPSGGFWSRVARTLEFWR